MSARRRVTRRLLIVSVFAMFAAWDTAGSEFANAVTYPVGTSPSAVIVADFNGDGKLDLAVANSGSNNVSVLLGNGDGTLKPSMNFSAGNGPSAIAVGDFNGDGKLDLAVFQPGDSTNGVTGAVSILLGNGDGTFQVAKTTALTSQAASMVVGDFNSDKKSDLVIGNIDSAASELTLNLFVGNGDGTFSAPQELSTFSNGTQALLAADLNGDGKLDLAVGSSASAVSILLGNGDGTFHLAPGGAVVTADSPLSIRVADLTGNGSQDLIVESFHETWSTVCLGGHNTFNSLDTYLNNGDGSFQEGRSVFSLTIPCRGVEARSYALGDYNGDKKSDLAYASATGILEVLGKGTGTFSSPLSLDTVGGSVASAADLNGDGLSDLVSLGPGNAVSVFLNTSPTSGADLGIMQASASPEPVGVGNNLTYTADVLNEGPKDATGVTLTDTLPSGATFVSATATQGSCIQSHGIVTCNIGSLASAFDAQATIIVTPSAPGSIMNSMEAAANEPDLVAGNNSAKQTSTVLPVYTLTVTKSGNGTGTVTSDPGVNGQVSCGSTCSATFLSGTAVNVNQVADSGSLFQSWGGACSGSNGCTVTMGGDETVSTSFVLGMTLSVTLAGTGTGSVTSGDGSISCSNSGGSCSALYLPGTAIALTAAPGGTSIFGGWSGGCTGTDPNTCNVTLNSNETVTATFNPPPDFTISPAATSFTVSRGGENSEVLTFAAQSGFSGPIALACSVSGPAPMPTCSLSPASVTPGTSATLTVDAAALAAQLKVPSMFEGQRGFFIVCLPLGLFACVLAMSFDRRRRRVWAVCLLMLVATVLPVACGGGSGASTQPAAQNYTVTVTATSGALQHSTNITVTVQ
jgi:uncharacterized repeat protein (TIGR01451 family)